MTTGRIITIVGPTAAGKTALGHAYATRHGGEILSLDSRQVYRRLCAGTAKPLGSWKNGAYLVDGIPYHLVDICEPTQPFSAADFVRLATERLSALQSAGKSAIMVGGTGFYLRALTQGLATLPTADPAVRKRLQDRANVEGRQALHNELRQVDPVAAERIPANNIARLVRALEVFELTGKPISEWHAEHQDRIRRTDVPWRLRVVGLDYDLATLDPRIQERCEAMLRDGMIEETQALLDSGIPGDAPALTSVGYPQIIRYLKGELSRASLLRELVLRTRQYAKRQLTWFRHQPDIEWLTPVQAQELV